MVQSRRVRILIQRPNVRDGDASICTKPGIVFEVLLKRDVGGVLGLHLHQDGGEVDTLKAYRVDAVRISEGADGVEHAFPIPVFKGAVADGNGDDRLMLKVEPVRRVLLAFQDDGVMLSHEWRSVDGALAKSIDIEHEEHRTIGRGSKGDMSITTLRDESVADVVGGCIVLVSDGGIREMIEVRHVDEWHVDINGLRAHRLLKILGIRELLKLLHR
jgi:hypothetical protein